MARNIGFLLYRYFISARSSSDVTHGAKVKDAVIFC